MFLIYDPEALPDAKHFINIWQNLAKKNGLSGIHFVGLQNAAVNRYQKIFDLGFDALAPSNLWHAEEQCKGRWSKFFLIIPLLININIVILFLIFIHLMIIGKMYIHQSFLIGIDHHEEGVVQ